MKEFDEVFNNIPKEDLEELEILRKKDIKSDRKSILLVIFFILMTILNFYIAKMIVIGEIIICYVVHMLSKKIPISEFTGKYKEKIIKPIVESYNNEFSYNLDNQITEEEYSQTGYSTGDEFYHSNYFETIDGKMKASEISILNKSEDKDGNTNYKTLFDGVFFIITLNNFSKEVITAKTDSKIRNFLNIDNKVEVDSSEFEKNFDLYCKNRIYAMELFTSDFLVLLAELSEKDDTKYDFVIKENKLYVRYHKGTIFNINVKKALQEESIKNIYENFYKMMNLLTNLQKHIDEKLETIN